MINRLANIMLTYEENTDTLILRKVQARNCQYEKEGRYGILYKTDITEAPCMIEIPEASRILSIPPNFLIGFSQYDLK